jgi:hypothetical protein
MQANAAFVAETSLATHTSIGAHNEHFLHHRRRGRNSRSCGLLGSAPLNKQFDTSEVGLTRRVSTDVHRVIALRMMRLASGGSVAGPMISEKASAFEESEGHHEAAKALALAVTGVMVIMLIWNLVMVLLY